LITRNLFLFFAGEQRKLRGWEWGMRVQACGGIHKKDTWKLRICPSLGEHFYENMGEKPVSESSVVFFCENFVKCR
jgi:hypothetical protein